METYMAFEKLEFWARMGYYIKSRFWILKVRLPGRLKHFSKNGDKLNCSETKKYHDMFSPQKSHKQKCQTQNFLEMRIS